MALNGSAAARQGASIYVYAANASMDECFFQSADGEWLIIPQEGGLVIVTEFGKLDIDPGFIAIIPRGIRFQVNLASSTARVMPARIGELLFDCRIWAQLAQMAWPIRETLSIP
jgi:homogentisate 1,2-dioxygenase